MNTKELLGNSTTKVTAANSEQLEFRTKLFGMLKNNPLPEAELERNMGLFVRGSLLARLITISDLYRRIVDIPGTIFDLGCWWGQNSILFENCRSIFEPFNKQRKIVSFDSFEGYTSWCDKDKKTEILNQNTYSTSLGYEVFLRELLECHEGINNLGHQRGIHEVIRGDATNTVKTYLERNPETIIALAAFDLGLYTPTKAVLESIKPHLIPGSILLMMHLTRKDLSGDGQAFLEVFKNVKFKINKCSIYPSFSVVEVV